VTDERDEELARRSRGGDQKAFAEIVARYERPLYALALRMTGNRDDAAELLQIVFVKAWKGLGGFDDRRRFFSWIYRIAIHECLNHRRTAGRFQAMEFEPPSPLDGPEAETESSDLEARVQCALNRLPAKDREIVVLKHFLDRSYEEIGEAIGVPVKTVKSRLFTARQRLKTELERDGVTES
jgi:RNA polymerase sigma-70 factor (ECF subfamily)